MIDGEKIELAGRRLADAAGAGSKVILFGSHARGNAHPQSDLDFLVVERALDNRIDEAVRLRRAVGSIGVPVDILVYSEQHVREWGEVKNTALYEALHEGRVIAET